MITTAVNPPLTDALVDRLVDIWVAATNAGGALGFEAPVTRDAVEHGVAGFWDRRLDGQLDLVVAEEGGRVLGFGFLEPGAAVTGHMGEISKLQRDPAASGRGIGSAVLAALEAQARERGLARVSLTVRGGTGREAYYQAHGYRHVATLPEWVRVGGRDLPLLVMVKDVAGGGPGATGPAASRDAGAAPPAAAGTGAAGPTGASGAGPLQLPVRRLDPDLPLPAYARPGDAGLDLHARERRIIPPQARVLMPTGIAVAIPDGYVGLVHPRSGLAIRQGLSVVNAPGTIDAGYRGEVLVPLLNTDPSATIRLERGDRIAQLLIQRVERAALVEVDELPDGVRGTGGFGSTGR